MVRKPPVAVAGWFIAIGDMYVVMRKNVPFLAVIAGILIILIALFLYFGSLKHAREEGLAQLTGQDEQTRIIRNELDEYRITNKNQQLGILVVGSVIVVVTVIWWGSQRNRKLD